MADCPTEPRSERTATERLLGLLERKGAARFPRGDDLFVDHLVGVSTIVESWDCAATVVRAGLFHSIYGTSRFDEAICGDGDRAEVRELFGADAEELVFLFCRMRRSCLLRCMTLTRDPYLIDRGTGARHPITPRTLTDLVCLHIADVLDNNTRYRCRPANRGRTSWFLGHYVQTAGRNASVRLLAALARRTLPPRALADVRRRL